MHTLGVSGKQKMDKNHLLINLNVTRDCYHLEGNFKNIFKGINITLGERTHESIF